jgi:hypothetical protein
MPNVSRPLTDSMLDSKTPKEVHIRTEAAPPVEDATLGIAVSRKPDQSRPKNRLVAVGDSLSQGFQSGAIFNTDLSWPVILAWELGWDDQFRRPGYPGFGGLPLNIEYLVRALEEEYGDRLDPFELPGALFSVRDLMANIEDYWERGPGKEPIVQRQPNHNLAVYGWDLRDALSRDASVCLEQIKIPKDNWFNQIVENANERVALRVLASDPAQPPITSLSGAARLGLEGTVETPGVGDGIETLVVMLGANNALGTIVNLKVRWSIAPDFKDLKRKQAFTVWNPEHFKTELDEVVGQIAQVHARHVILATVPHVTIAPLARGVGTEKVEPGSRYFPYYTRPWISDQSFDPSDDPRITAQEVRAVDSAIDQYNDAIVDAVAKKRKEGKDWYVLDLCGMLDRLATRRYITDPDARPSWWRPYELPPALAALQPPLDSRFLASDSGGRTAGGIFSLDGVHPSTVGYGLIAQEVANVMHRAGVKFFMGDGKTQRPGPVQVDFARLIGLDTLISAPPRSLTSLVSLIGWLDQKLDVIRRLMRPLA